MKASWRDFHPPELTHLLALLLIVQELALSRGVAAVALGGDVLAKRPDGLANGILTPKAS